MKEKLLRKQLIMITLFSTFLLLPFAVNATEPQPLNLEAVKCPVVGEKPTYMGGTTPYTERFEERWVNITDRKEMGNNEVFEANKQYDYEYGYALKENYYGHYLNFPPINYANCNYSLGGVGSDTGEDGSFVTNNVGFYTGDMNSFAPTFNTIAFDVAAPTLGGHPTTIQANNKYRINSQKWYNTTDCVEMTANDVFVEGKKYKLIVNFSSFYDSDGVFENFEESQYYLGTSYFDNNVEHIGQMIVSAYFYFGNKSDLAIDGRVTLGGNKAPVAGQKISNFVVTDNIPELHMSQYWSVERRIDASTTEYDQITDPNAVFEAGKKYIYNVYYDLEPGYTLPTFEVTNNNKNASFVDDYDYSYDSPYGTYAYYSATYLILEPGKTFGINNETSDIIFPGSSAWLTIYPQEKEADIVTWTSSNEEIATVSNGWVNGITPGNVTITAIDSEGETATYDITVGVPAEAIEINKTTLTLHVGDTEKLTAVLTPSNTMETVSWRTDWPDGMSYSELPVQTSTYGDVTAIRPGTIDVIAYTQSGLTATCTVTVLAQEGVPVTSVALNKSSETIEIGDSFRLTATIKPDNATDKNVIWISERPNIASVENGLVTGLEAGTTTITVQTSNGKTATCTVTVKTKYSVTFYDSDGTTILKEPTLYPSDTNASEIVKPTPTKENQVLEGWYTDKELTHKYHFEGTLQGDLDLYAKWEDIRIELGRIPADIDFGETYTEFEDDIVKTVTINNIGNVDVSLDIKNPTESGPFASLSFETGKVLKPGEQYVVRLMVQAGRPFSDIAGTYNGNYQITATYVNDNTKTHTLSIPATIKLNQRPISIKYQTHVQSYGWQNYVADGAMSGTSGQGKRLEGIKIKLEHSPYGGNVEYKTHVQSYGWQEYVSNGTMSGTSGEAKRLEAIQIKLTGEVADHYDVYYRVHAQSFGWLGWARNDEPAGTARYAKRLEGIEIKLVEKGTPVEGYGELAAFKDKLAPESITLNETNISIEEGDTATLIATVLPEDATDKTVTWTSSEEENVTVDANGKLTAVHTGTATITAKTVNGKTATCNVNVLPPIAGVAYKTHVQSYGWQEYVSNGTMSGTSGKAKRLEGIKIKLKNQPYTGDIEYRTHIQSYGWENEFKKNDTMSGTSGEAKRLEAIEIRLTGQMAEHFDIYYRVHAQSFGWLGWAKNGEQSGTAGYAKRLEGIEIVLVNKGEQPPARDNQNDERAYIANQS